MDACRRRRRIAPGRCRAQRIAQRLRSRAADHAAGDQGLDLASGIAELAEHLGGVLAEFRRRAAQARLGALEPDRRGDALVPILFDDVAAMERCAALVSAWSIFCTGPAGRPAASRRSHSGSASCWLNTAASSARSASRLAMRSLLRAKRGSVPSSGLPISLRQLAEGAVIADADEDVVGPGREDRVRHQIGMLVAGQRRRLAVHEIIRGMRMHDGEAGLVQRGLQKLAATPDRCRSDSAIRMPIAA